MTFDIYGRFDIETRKAEYTVLFRPTRAEAFNASAISWS